jgi:hypothetical protein
MKKFIIFFILFCFCKNTISQSLAINTTAATANTSSILDVSSTTKGLLLPRMNKAQKNAIATPATGLLVYQTSPDSVGFQYFDGVQWLWLEALVNSNTAWKTKGNTGTDTALNFIGTIDNMPLRFKQNGIRMGDWDLQKNNYFLGNGSGLNNTSSHNIAFGDSALFKSKNGTEHVAIGSRALYRDTTLTFNPSNGFISPSIGIGTLSLANQKLGSNIGIGSFAGFSNTFGSNNTAIGNSSLGFSNSQNDSLSNNTVVGNAAMLSANRSHNNTVIGSFSFFNADSAFDNTIIGYSASAVTKANKNTIIGSNAKSTGISNLINASAIGAYVQVDTSNSMVLGSISGVNGATANVNVGVGTTKPKAALHVSRGSSGNTLNIPSSRISLFEDNATHYLQLLSPNIDETGIMAGNNLTLEKSSIRFANDSSINFRTGGGNERVTIQNNGNVGIGNAVPFVPLHVSRGGALINASYASNATAIFENGAGVGNASLQLINSSTGDYSIFSGTELSVIRSSIIFKKDSSIYFSTGNSIAERISVSKSGFIGINNPVPKSLLHIAATGVNEASSYYFPENNLIVEDTSLNITAGLITNATHLIANNNNASAIIAGSKQNPLTSSIVFRNDDRSIRFVTNASNANGSLTDVIFDSSGRVGIGFTNPATSLGINGGVTFIQDNANTINAATVTITVGNRTFFRVNSDAAPASRKLALTNGLFTGQMLILQCIATGVNGFRIEDADANIDITGATFNMLTNDTITFIWDGNEWVELHRSDN